eukprot:TRINITY_DN1206_c0_g2_i2.p1 TRINITY_DN1206_c0_g2~~TRINITY_DN1206_c0_g2_i2.p1  ORF type:complete len:585 (+),score=169.73 TRINITY_DN1206_c0_g2_i2:54-1808(+)
MPAPERERLLSGLADDLASDCESPEPAAGRHGHSHDHSHAHSGHGHGHGHSHGHGHGSHSDSGGERGHGHSHGHSSHGHSHGDGHGHSHVHELGSVAPERKCASSEDRGHGHGHSHGSHGHSHGDSHRNSCGSSVGISLPEPPSVFPISPPPSAATPPPPQTNRAQRALLLAICLSSVFMIAELVGGYIAHSVAIMSDAAHLFGDVASFILALLSLKLSARPPSPHHTYGWHRAEVVGAFGSLLTVWFLTLWIVTEATGRLIEYVRCARMSALEAANHGCRGVDGKMMFAIGLGGLAVNVTLAAVLWYGNAGSHVQHMHSHGADGVCPSGHGHSHASGGCGGGQPDKAITDITELLSVEVTNPHHGGCGHGHGHGHGQKHAGCGGHGHGHGHGHSHSKRKAGFTEAKEGEDVNVKGAMVHAVGDCLQSLGVVLAATIIWVGNNRFLGTHTSRNSWFNLADPCTSFVFAVVTVWTTKAMLLQMVRVLMEGAPDSLNCALLRQDIQSVAGVVSVHDLHAWMLKLGKTAATVHVVVADGARAVDVVAGVHGAFRRHSIDHVTVQVDSGSCVCRTRCKAPPLVISASV